MTALHVIPPPTTQVVALLLLLLLPKERLTADREDEDNSNNTTPLDALTQVQARRLEFTCRAAINVTAHVSEKVLNSLEAHLKKWLLSYFRRLVIIRNDVKSSYAWGVRRGESFGYLDTEEEDAEEEEAKMRMLGHKPPFNLTTE